MRTVTHREMRNQSGDILRQVAAGETVGVTNKGQVAALIVPPGTDPLADLVSRGQVRVARNPTSSLRSIVRRKSNADSQAIMADVRGRSGIRHLIAGTLTPTQAVEQDLVTILQGNLKLLERFTELFRIDA